MTFQNRLAALAVFGLLVAAPLAAQAQQTDMNCNPVPYNDDRAFTEEICNTHAACRAISKFMDKTCKAVQFVQKLTGKLTQEAEAENPKYDTLPAPEKKSWLQKVFSSDDAAEAAEPVETNSKALRENEAAVDRQFDQRVANNSSEKTFDSGAVYEGEMKNGLPNGVGLVVFPDGQTGRGEFKDGKLNGLGEDTHPDGEVNAGREMDGNVLAGAHQTTQGVVVAGIFQPAGHAIGLTEDDLPNGQRNETYVDNDGKAQAYGEFVSGDAEPVAPKEPAGLPPEPNRDVPLWSPQAPVGSIMAEEMRWDPDAKLDWAALSPEDGTDPLGNARFCRPLTGTLTSLQQQQCNQDRQEVTAKLKSKDPIGERMFCQPLTGYMPPDLMEACGIQPEPPPVQTARPAPAPVQAPAPQQRVAINAPQSISVVQMCAKEIAEMKRANPTQAYPDAELESTNLGREEYEGEKRDGQIIMARVNTDPFVSASGPFLECTARVKLMKLDAQSQQRVAVAAPPPTTSLANCIVRSKNPDADGFDIQNNCGQALWIEVLRGSDHRYDSAKFEPGMKVFFNDTNPVITQLCHVAFSKADPTDYGDKMQEICQSPAR